MALPALRNLDATPVQHEGDTMILLRDPEGFAEEQIALSGVAFFVATLLDGTNDVTDIQYLFCRNSGGRVLPEEEISKIVEYLDEHGFLLTERFEEIYADVVRDFAARPTREAAMAGGAYPDMPEEAHAFLDRFFLHEEGPGAYPADTPAEDAPARCVIAPHIDFERGGATYAHSYLRLSRGQRPDTVLLFGVAHASPPVPFTLTRKHFETPFGLVETDQELAARLATALPYDAYEHEIVHRTEHSLEFQAVMLGYLYGSAVQIVPMLCGMFTEDTGAAAPSAEVESFLEACRKVVADSDKMVGVVAGADLAHVGKRFGDDFEIDEPVIERVHARDIEDLAHVTALDAEAWYRSVMQDDNARRVCGLNCIYAALKSVDGTATRGECLHYGYAHDPAGGIVSFASIVLS
jgi:AmmeMemoRadiSam system protein B